MKGLLPFLIVVIIAMYMAVTVVEDEFLRVILVAVILSAFIGRLVVKIRMSI